MRGVTLVEMLLVLAFTGFGISLLVPAARSAADRFAVVGAREEVAGRLTSARTMALARGGATLVLDEATASGWIEAEDLVWDSGGLAPEAPVEMTLPGGRTRARLRFDALGIGRVASQTVRFTRGRATASLVISAYGGVSRR